MYKVYDDIGVLKEGTKLECREAVKEWLDDPEAWSSYSEEEIQNGLEYFSREEASSFMGFTITRV